MRRIGSFVSSLVLLSCAMVETSIGQAPPRQPPPGTPPPQPGPAPAPPAPPAPTPPAPAGPGQPLARLTPQELGRWQAGRGTFQQEATPLAGLGPVFNENSCVRCHGGPAPGGSGPQLVTRFGRTINGQFDPMVEFGGPAIQSRGIGLFRGVNFVGEVVPRQATIVARRRTTPLFGLGLVDGIPDSTLMNLAVAQHEHFPALAGLPGMIHDPSTGEERVGRFGWKSQQATLFSFTADALVNEMGITTPVFSTDNCPQGNCATLSADPARTHPNAPTTATIQQLTDFMSLNAPPPPGPVSTAAVAGQIVFGTIGCAVCHQPTFQTGTNPVGALNGVTFTPYSDFLLHDMGSLGDGIVQGSANGSQMRTAPLWGPPVREDLPPRRPGHHHRTGHPRPRRPGCHRSPQFRLINPESAVAAPRVPQRTLTKHESPRCSNRPGPGKSPRRACRHRHSRPSKQHQADPKSPMQNRR